MEFILKAPSELELMSLVTRVFTMSPSYEVYDL